MVMTIRKKGDAMARVVAFAEEMGFRALRTPGGHLKFVKEGHRPVFFSSTPGDRRAPLNAISNIRKSVRGVL